MGHFMLDVTRACLVLDHAEFTAQVRAAPAHRQGEQQDPEEEHHDVQLPRDAVHRRHSVPKRGGTYCAALFCQNQYI